MQKKEIAKDHCHLTATSRELAQKSCILYTPEAHISFVSLLFHNFSGYDSHHVFEKLTMMAIEKVLRLKKEDNIAKPSENYTCKIGIFKLLGFSQTFEC